MVGGVMAAILQYAVNMAPVPLTGSEAVFLFTRAPRVLLCFCGCL